MPRHDLEFKAVTIAIEAAIAPYLGTFGFLIAVTDEEACITKVAGTAKADALCGSAVRLIGDLHEGLNNPENQID